MTHIFIKVLLRWELEQTPPTPANPMIELKSEKGVDYTKLRDLLAARKWIASIEKLDYDFSRAKTYNL